MTNVMVLRFQALILHMLDSDLELLALALFHLICDLATTLPLPLVKAAIA